MAIRLARILFSVLLGVLFGSGPAFAVDAAFLAPAETGQPGLAPPAADVIEVADHTPRVLTLDLTRDANDIWDRIRRGFGMPDLDSDRVAERQLFYLNRPAFLKKVFQRGGRYLWHIVDELERRGMPTELALLPMVESSFDPMAYSHAHASGLWQFIPSTGRNFNLVQDNWVDERRDVVASTAAALDYLQTIYEMHGDWHLALASYNWGEGSVGRAIARNKAEGLPTEYSHLRMPDETRNYVPKLQALKNIVAQPELFHIELPYVPNTRHFITVDAPVTIDLATAARLADMPFDEFVALNAGYKRPAVTEGSSLAVPVDRAEQFQLRLAEHQRNGANRWRTHALQRGETLASVARAYGLSLGELYRLNGLSKRSRLGPGHALLVPEGARRTERPGAAGESVERKSTKTQASTKKGAGKKTTKVNVTRAAKATARKPAATPPAKAR